MSYYLFVKNTKVVDEIVSINKPVYIFLQKKWYFDELYDQIFIRPSKSIGIFLWKKIDGSIIDKFGPDGVSNLIKSFSILLTLLIVN